MRNLLYLCFICLLSTSVGLPAWASGHLKTPLIQLDASIQQPVKPSLHCSKQFSANDSFERVKNSDDSLWYETDSSHLRSVFNDRPIWCQFRLKVMNADSWFIGFADPNINNIQLFFSKNEASKREAGSHKVFSDREIENRYFYFSIPKFINTEQQVYFRLQSLSLNSPIHLLTDNELATRVANRQSLSSMAFGFLIPLVISFFATRKLRTDNQGALRFWSLAIALSYTATSTAIQGFGFQFMWPQSVVWNTVAPLIFVAIGLVILWAYLDAYHGKLSKRWNIIFALSIMTTLLFSFSYFLSQQDVFYHLGLAFVILNAVFILVRHCYFLAKTPHSNDGMIWVIWMLLAGLCLCQSFGLLYLHFDIELVMAFNFSALVIILGADIYRLIQSNQQKLIDALEGQVAQEQHIAQLQHEKTSALEDQVAERTKELDRMMRELHLSNMRLRTASHTDALTGILNRYAVEHYIEEHWQRCLKNESYFGVGFVDVDHFKRVNDTFGHDAGDLCLKHLALLITNALEQVDMRVARFGGEEFIIIAPDMTAEKLSGIMEKLRSKLEVSPVHYQDQEIKLTVSIGIAAQQVTQNLHNRELIKQADTALYHAKNTGRNRVVQYSDLTALPPQKP